MRAEFGVDAVGHLNSVLAELASDGLIEFGKDHVRLTQQGRLLSNDVFARFLAEPVNA